MATSDDGTGGRADQGQPRAIEAPGSEGDPGGVVAPAAPGDGITYGSYLRVPQLLGLQQFESKPPAHDELLFITIHQAYELWFKQILFELDTVLKRMDDDDIYEAGRLMGRVLQIERLLVEQIHILETMTPRDFLSFRKALNPASGFQSVQFREMEFLSGIKDARVLEHITSLEPELRRLKIRLEGRSLRTSFYELLRRMHFGVVVPADGDELEGEERERTLRQLRRLYARPEKHFHIYSLAERLVEHDQNILLWRFHHVRVVERLIGTSKAGTGGSSGVKYLASTLNKRAFPLLWEVRGHLSDEELYGRERGRTETREGSAWDGDEDDDDWDNY